MLEKFGQQSQSAAQKLHVKSALNPLLWLTGIASPIFFGTAFVFKDTELVNVLIYAGMVPMVVTCLGFCFFALFKPEKLQSEDYQLKHESLNLMQEKCGGIQISTISLEQIVNPIIMQKEQQELPNTPQQATQGELS
ncbi:hypothetical protein PCNPT3_09320 [Psychromonas sp. CNPT3]|uniref:hypothetical protein n=1 Tax=Psychromonas sp. CNPT3 TaxID=314282 RepID=UPI0002C146CC|nr:hypothetical protein [Psychromonas sp. CNPT3]AGH81802.1 hypothetical protein PCNPT3_09320 [Psychromonas sp. CNPT3]